MDGTAVSFLLGGKKKGRGINNGNSMASQACPLFAPLATVSNEWALQNDCPKIDSVASQDKQNLNGYGTQRTLIRLTSASCIRTTRSS